MNDSNVPAVPQDKPPTLKRVLFDFMPTTMGEAIELAKMLAESTMVPRDYIGKPGNVLVAMQYGMELEPQLKPMQALQSIAIINGKPAIYGDAGKALLIANGCKIREFDTKEVEARGYAECTVFRPGHEAKTRTFSLQDAERAGLWGKSGPWTQYPYRQMSWRAFWFAARDAASDILKGMPPAEELRDMEVDITPLGETLPREEPKAPVSATSKLKERLQPAAKAAALIKEFDAATTIEQLGEATDKAATTMHDASPPDKAKVNAAYRAAKTRILPPEPKAEPQATATTTATNGTPDPLTDEQIIAGLKAAQTRDEIDLYCSVHISPLEEGVRKNVLLTFYNKQRAEFPE